MLAPAFVLFPPWIFYCAVRCWGGSGYMLGAQKQKHTKQPFGDASASHLSLVLRHVWFQADAWISRTTPLTPPSYEVGGIAKRIKPLAFGEKPNPVGPPIIVVLYWISTIWSGREVSSPYHAKSFLGDTTSFQEIILLSGVFRRERASGFYPWGNVVAPLKRVADGIVWLAAWKLVSNDAKRTVAPPNAKHSTLLQGCLLCFCFWLHSRFGNNA